MLLAVAVHASGRAEAVDVLAEALARAEDERIVRPFREGGAAVAGLLDDAIRSRRGLPFAEVVRSALTAGRPRPAGTAEGLSARELDVLRLLRSDLTGPEIAAGAVDLTNVLTYHVIPGRFDLVDVPPITRIPTLNGEAILFQPRLSGLIVEVKDTVREFAAALRTPAQTA